MIQVKSARDGATATVEAEGIIDTRGALEFESCLVGVCNDGARLVVVDLSKVDLMTSAGIRVLVMMAQRLQRSGGGLALCALSDRVRSVLEIAGLLAQFRIGPTREQAIALLNDAAKRAAATGPAGSRLTQMVSEALACDQQAPGVRRTAAAPSKLTSATEAALSRPTKPSSRSRD